MYQVNYTKKEIKEFQKALKTIIKDLNDLWNIGAVKNLVIPVELEGVSESFKGYSDYGWKFIMDENGFRFMNTTGSDDEILLLTKNNARTKKYLDVFPVDIYLIENYGKIRNDIVNEIEKALKEKKKPLESANNLLKKLDNEATIEIELPETNNEHRIEISSEDGMNIGTLKFGSLGLKIISSAKIEFKPKEKVKRK